MALGRLGEVGLLDSVEGLILSVYSSHTLHGSLDPSSEEEIKHVKKRRKDEINGCGHHTYTHDLAFAESKCYILAIKPLIKLN